MTRPHRPLSDALSAAKEDQDSVLALTTELVRIPSRGGIDPYGRVLDRVRSWLHAHGLVTTVLRDDDGAPVGVSCAVTGAHPGPTWVLDACLDTAPFGNETAWTHPPTSGVIADGWLWGRGTADSKIAVASFCHIAVRLARLTESLHGNLVVLFDVDEHTGNFGGAKRFFTGPDAPTGIAGVMIGYPGMDKLVVGGRGIYRSRLHVHGTASHSGGSATTPSAITKAAHLIGVLSAATLPCGTNDFPPPAKLTVTAITGGEGYSVTPDLCVLNVDMRTTPTFDTTAADEELRRLVRRVDDDWDTPATTVEPGASWPAYALAEDSLLRSTLLDAATALGLDVQPRIAGPSNIGNYLAGLGIPATAGFGPVYEGLHGTDERIRLDTVATAQAVYLDTVLRLLDAGAGAE